MLSVVFRVREGRPPKSRHGRSWGSIAAEAWGTDILQERSFLLLVGSRLAVLMAGGVLTQLAIFYLARSQGMDQSAAGNSFNVMVGLVALGTVITVIPAARLSDRVGRKKVIYLSCAIGAVGVALVAVAPSFPLALVGAGVYGLSAGIFLAVDWALMTDIIPKASSGRYMGLSNVATASSGVLAIALGGTLMDVDRRRRWPAGRPVDGRRAVRHRGRAAATRRRAAPRGRRATGGGGRPGTSGLTPTRHAGAGRLIRARSSPNQRRQVSARRKSNGSGRRYSHGTSAHRNTR